MKRNFSKRIPLLLLLAALLVSCDTTPPPETDTETVETVAEIIPFEEALDGYVIMRPDASSDAEMQVATTLRDALKEKGLSLAPATDWVSPKEEMPVGTKEILIGSTNRPETAQYGEGLRLGEFTVAYANGRYVLVAGDEDSLADACDWFVGHLDSLTNTDGVLYSQTVDYPIESVTIAGSDISEYSILYTVDAEGESSCAALLQEMIARQVGLELPVKQIVREVDLTRDYNAKQIFITMEDKPTEGYRVTVEDGKMTITAGDRLQLRAAVMEIEQYMEDKIMQFENGTTLTGKLERTSVTLYADASATTGGDGTSAKPYATGDELYAGILEKTAKEALNITVVLKAGDYPLTKTMALDGTNTALSCSTVQFVCEDDEQARFIAWQAVTGFKETTVNGVTAWEADLPTVGDTVVYPNQCFNVSGDRLERPRYPAGNGELEVGLEKAAKEYAWNDRMNVIGYSDDTIETFTRLDDIQVHMFHYWNDDRLEIDRIDTEANKIYTKTQAGIAFVNYGKGAPYYLDNVYEMLKEPGQFYVDKQTNKLLYIPTENDTIDNFTLYASNIDVIMTVDGMHGSEEVPGASFTNIGFIGSDWKSTNRGSGQAASDIHGAVRVNDASYVQFDHCTFSHIGDYALEVQEAVSYMTVSHCNFTDLGAGGITIYGVNEVPATDNVNHDLVITDNYIGHWGLIHTNGIGVVMRYAYDSTIAHNEITDGCYSGVSVGWRWGYDYHVTNNILVEKNYIHHVGNYMLSDMGGIYTLGQQPGTVIRGNLIHDVYSRSGKGWGLYTDEGSSDIVLENNIVYNTKSECFVQHYGKENIVRNNIFALGGTGAVYMTRQEDHVSFRLEHNIFLTDGKPIYAQYLKYCSFKDDSNLMWNLSGDVYGPQQMSVEEMQKNGYFINALVADPGFADPKNGDFTLPADSPAYDIGFVDIDMSDVGIRE